jgi:hypothetical protein
MKLDVRLPILFRATPTTPATPRASLEERWVQVPYAHSVDIPEISASEADIALDRVVEVGARLNELPTVREYRGRLYREVGGNAYFEDAFANPGIARKGREYMSSPTIWTSMWKMGDSPVAFPVENHHDWKIETLALSVSRNNRMWIQRSGDKNTFPEYREALLALADVNSEDIAENLEMFEHQCSKLIRIGGVLHYESRPPCVTVEFTSEPSYMARAEVTMDFLSDMPDENMLKYRFPLSDMREAFDFAASFIPGAVAEGARMIDLVDISHPLLAFDRDREDVYRTAFVLASGLVRKEVQAGYRVEYRDRDPLYQGKDAALFGLIEAGLMGSNNVVGRRAPISAMLPEIADLWQRSGRPLYGVAREVNVPKYLNRAIKDNVAKSALEPIGFDMPHT